MFVFFRAPTSAHCAIRVMLTSFFTSDIDEHDELAAAGEATAQKNGTNGTNH